MSEKESPLISCGFFKAVGSEKQVISEHEEVQLY